MGFEGIYRIYRKTENGNYEEMTLYDRHRNKLENIFPSYDGMINQILLGYNRQGYDFDSIGAGRGVPKWYVNQLKIEHPEYFNDSFFRYNEFEGTWYDYVELRGYCGNCKYSYIDYDSDKDEPSSRNPIDTFMNVVNMYLELFNIWRVEPGEIIIICEMGY